MKSKNKRRNMIMISVIALIILLGVVYIRKLISRHDINPYNVKYSTGQYIEGALPARESSILINNISDVINNEKLNELKVLDFGAGDGRHTFRTHHHVHQPSGHWSLTDGRQGPPWLAAASDD